MSSLVTYGSNGIKVVSPDPNATSYPGGRALNDNFRALDDALAALQTAAAAATAHMANTGNPHSTTKAQVGLGNVANALQLVAASNLSDLASASSARGNLGLGSAAVLNASAAVTPNLVARWDGSGNLQAGVLAAVYDVTVGGASLVDAIVGCLVAGNDLSDLGDVATALANLGLGASDSPSFAGLTLTDYVRVTSPGGSVDCSLSRKNPSDNAALTFYTDEDPSGGWTLLLFGTPNLEFYNRAFGATQLYLNADGSSAFAGNLDAPGFSVSGAPGFTGSGAYANFTIVGGIIVDAS